MEFWQGMWEYRAPAAHCFLAPVKPRARQLFNIVNSNESMDKIPQGSEFYYDCFKENSHKQLIFNRKVINIRKHTTKY